MKKYTLILLATLFAFGLTTQNKKKMLCKKWAADVEAMLESMPKEMTDRMATLSVEEKEK